MIYDFVPFDSLDDNVMFSSITEVYFILINNKLGLKMVGFK